jgi:hypothetical protein
MVGYIVAFLALALIVGIVLWLNSRPRRPATKAEQADQDAFIQNW